MTDPEALGELLNQQRPVRRNEKTYGKRKPGLAQSRAMHFELFGGGHETALSEKMAAMTVKEKPIDSHVRVAVESPKPIPEKRNETDLNPRLRGRRKVHTSKRIAKLTQDKIDALSPLLALCRGQVQDFHEFGRDIGKKYDCTKLGEGAFADVFKLKAKEPKEALDLERYGGLVIKVIPFNIENDADDEIADLESVTREVRVLQALDPLHGFARCRGVHVVSGKYPDVLSEAFNLYQTTDPREAINPDPTQNLPPDQLYVIIEMNDAGIPLSKLSTMSAFRAFDIFWISTMVLSMAEQKLEFEHRDLHDGNLCFKPAKADGQDDVYQHLIEDMKEMPDTVLGLSNLAVTVIDYTLARARIADKEGEIVVFDPIAFWDTNDAQGEYKADAKQYDTYRRVRDWAKATEEQAKAEAELDGIEYTEVDKYSRSMPRSNVMWLGYLVMNLRLRRTEGRGAYVQGSSRMAKKVQLKMWKTLEAVDAYINKTAPTLLPRSADELLSIAVEQKWLTEEDISAFSALLQA